VDGVLISGFSSVLERVSLVLFLLALFAFIDAAFRRPDAYRAADKHTKAFWLIILGIAAAVMYLFPLLSFLPVAGLIAVVVYLVDVKPAVRAISGGSGRGGPRSLRRRSSNRSSGGGSSSDGPYGPYNGRR